MAAVPFWVFFVAAVLVLTVAWRSSRQSAAEITEDSLDFQEALKKWLPWLMAKQGTPRAVKRFINRLRYLAVRLRQTSGEEDGRFPEPNTVAMAAIHFFDPDWLKGESAYQAVTDGKIEGLLGPGKGVAAKMNAAQVQAFSGLLSGCVEQYADWMAEDGLSDENRQARGSWKPSKEHRAALLAVINEKGGA